MKAKPTCKNNLNIVCRNPNCDTCGWNPIVSENRLLKIKLELAKKAKRRTK